MPQNFYEALWIFLIYAFIGWCTEVAYATLKTGKFINRGFLNGPVCPIYGCGVLLVVLLLEPLKANGLVLFVGSFIVTTAIEFVTGFVLEKLFHNRWWDYSAEPFNIMGYVCLRFSIIWGLACLFVVLIVHTAIYGFISLIPTVLGYVLLAVLALAFASDLVVTVLTILKFNQHLQKLDEVAKQLHRISEELGESISDNVVEAMERSEEFKEEHAEAIEKFEAKQKELKEMPAKVGGKLREQYEKIDTKEERQEIIWRERERLLLRYQELQSQRKYGYERLMKAFPGMRSTKNDQSLQKYMRRFKDF